MLKMFEEKKMVGNLISSNLIHFGMIIIIYHSTYPDISYDNSHIWPPLVAIFLALRVWEAFGAS